MIVIDIETIPAQEEKLPTYVKEYLNNDRRFNGIDGRLKNKEKIEAAKQTPEAESKRIKARSLSSDFGQIIVIGIIAKYMDVDDSGEPFMHTEEIALTGNEVDILKEFWQILQYHSDKIVVANGINFDIPFIIKRSIYNNIKPTVPIKARKYNYDQVFDVTMALANWDVKNALPLEVYAEMMGIKRNTSDYIGGANVYDEYKKGNIDDIARYCIEDCRLTLKVYDKIHIYYDTKVEREMDTSIY